MSANHHGDSRSERELAEIRKRFLDQMEGTAKRQYPAGRMGADDDGALSMGITTDMRHRTVVIRFGKPVEWIGLGVSEVEYLRDQLTERLMDLRGVTA